MTTDEGNGAPTRTTAASRGESVELLRLFDPEVERTRVRLFGSTQPLPAWPAAAKWIERQARVGASKKKGEEVYRRAVRACASLSQLTGYDYDLRPPMLALARERQPASGRQAVSYVRYGPKTNLALLHRAVSRIAVRTGFSETEVLRYVMVGMQPCRIRQRRTVPSRYVGERQPLR